MKRHMLRLERQLQLFRSMSDLYPGSKRIQEVYDYLVGTLMQIKNYKAALAALDKIGNKDSRLEEAYQESCIFQGIGAV